MDRRAVLPMGAEVPKVERPGAESWRLRRTHPDPRVSQLVGKPGPELWPFRWMSSLRQSHCHFLGQPQSKLLSTWPRRQA